MNLLNFTFWDMLEGAFANLALLELLNFVNRKFNVSTANSSQVNL